MPGLVNPPLFGLVDAGHSKPAAVQASHHRCYHDGMKRTTVSFEEPTLKRLRRAAAERATSIAELTREAVDEKLAAMRPRPRSLGAGASGFTDTSELAGEERPEPRSWR